MDTSTDSVKTQTWESMMENMDKSLYFVHGDRTYNATSWVYRFPADQEEVIRQDRQHYVLSATLPGLYRGPVDEILAAGSGRFRRLLDIGCGTGIWLAEMAERFPETDCVGVDIMPLQHDHQLRNCTYMIAEVPLGTRVFPSASFDVIHIRQMLHAVNNFQAVLREAYRLLRPGGILLVHEIQLHAYSAWEGYTPKALVPATFEWLIHLKAAYAYRGVFLDNFHNIDNMLLGAGFEKDKVDAFVHYRQPLPDDPDTELGRNELAHNRAYIRATKLIMLEAGRMTEEEFDVLAAEASAEFTGHGVGPCGPLGARGILSPWGYWWARKEDPVSSGETARQHKI